MADGKKVKSLPAIVQWGQSNVHEFPVSAYWDSFVRAFKIRKADFIVLDDIMTGQRFLAASVAWGMQEQLLEVLTQQADEQVSVTAFQLTDKGKKRLLI